MSPDTETGIIVTRDEAGYEYYCEVAVGDLERQHLLDAQVDAETEREVRATHAVEHGWIHTRVYPNIEEPTADPFRFVFDEERGRLVAKEIDDDQQVVA